MQGDYTKLCYGLNGEGHSNRQFPAARLICPERVGQESRRKRSVKYLIERTDGSKGDKNPRRNLRMFVRIRKEGGGVRFHLVLLIIVGLISYGGFLLNRWFNYKFGYESQVREEVYKILRTEGLIK